MLNQTTIKLFKTGLIILFVRSGGALSMFLLTVYLARHLGANNLGLFSLALTLMTIFAMVSRWGLESVLLKNISAHHKNDSIKANSYFYSGLLFVFVFSLLLSVLLFYLDDLIIFNLLHKPNIGNIYYIFIGYVISFSIVFLIGESFKAIRRPILSSLFQSFLIPFLTLCILFFYFRQDLLSIDKATIVFVLISFFVSIISLIFAVFFFEISKKIYFVSFKELLVKGWPMLSISSGALIMSWSDVLILGIYSSSSDVGLYSAASRTVMVTTLLLAAVNSIVAPKYALYHSKNMTVEISRLARLSSFLLFILSLLPLFLFLLYSEWVMNWFGAEFKEASKILIILSIGQFINVSCGSVGYLMMMTGAEVVYRNIMISSATINIIMSVALVKSFGVIGVAISTMTSVILWNVISVIYIKRKFGFWMIDFRYLYMEIKPGLQRLRFRK